MTGLPLIVGFGGINAAGRSSGHHGYRRTILRALPEDQVTSTWAALAGLTGRAGAELTPELREDLRAHSLLRRIEAFEPHRAPWNRCVKYDCAPFELRVERRSLPEALPPGWTLVGDGRPDADGRIVVRVEGPGEVLVPDERVLPVSSAGEVPTGFDPGALYQARSHPRAVQLTLFAASDCLQSVGIPWETILAAVRPDQVATYAGSAMAQLDEYGNGGLMGNRWRGGRITSKHVPMGLGEMAADFVNAYVLGSVGRAGHNMGACATWLYNLRLGVEDIQSGRARVALVGGSEASIVPDVVDGLATMGALAQDQALLQIEGRDGEAGAQPDYQRACRPFGENAGFVIAEGSQFVLLMDEALALELGADVHGAVGDVFVHADGHKKSISSPGVGNYVTFAKAVASARRHLGEESVQQRSFVHAHGTGTPQNRVSESEILDIVARANGIGDWPVAAVKCYVGHTMAGAGGDQLMSALGTFRHGIVPGIQTIDAVADDVLGERLQLGPEHIEREVGSFDVAFLNAKGFGGNNATGYVVSPEVAVREFEERHGAVATAAWRERVEATRAAATAADQRSSAEGPEVVYKFNHDVRMHEHVAIDGDRMTIEGVGEIEL